MRAFFLAALLTELLFSTTSANAARLPYSVRDRDFSSWTPATKGDTNTVGMGGATLALPTSISAAEENPAGYAMLTGSVSAQINKVSLIDQRLQRSGEAIETSQWGLGVSPVPWGFSVAYYSPQTESGTYVSPNTGDTVKTEVSLKELRLTGARAFINQSLALGASIELLKAVRELDDADANNYAMSFRLGALYRLPHHVVLGASFAPRVTVGPAQSPDPQTTIPGFNRSVVRPMLIGIGSGWIPNRFFKAGVSLTYVGSTENTALLADQSITTGARNTWVPRLGLSYVVAEYQNFKIEAAGGSYYEVSRLSGRSNRLHLTGGLEANPYFINLGAGFDLSSEYHNLIVSVGIDIVRTLRAFDIIPKDNLPPLNGKWPSMTVQSADGLPNGLTAGEEKTFAPSNVDQVSKIVEKVPENIAKKVQGKPTTVEQSKKPKPSPQPLKR